MNWKLDQQTSIVVAVLGACIMLAFYRSMFPTTTEDKILDMMVTILFSTCLVTVVNYHFGSSRSSAIKDENAGKITEKLAEKVTGTGTGTFEKVITTVPTEPATTPTTTTVTETKP